MLKKHRQIILVIGAALLFNLLNLQAANFKPIPIIKDTLPNGLTVVYSIDKTAPVIATVIHYKVGSRYETPGKTGYAHFFEHLMFEATKSYERASIDKFVEEAGGNLNAHTSFDETVFYLKLPSNNLELALWIESSRMRGLKVDTIGVQTQKGVVSEELKMRRENTAYGTLLDKMSEFLFKGTNYEWTTIGSLQDIQNAKNEDFRTFYDTYYYPNNAVLAIVGDFDLEEARALVNKYFGRFQRHTIPPEKDFIPTPIEKPVRETIVDEKAQLPGIFIGYRGCSKLDPDNYALELLTQILASGESSRFYQTLVDKKQLAVAAAVFPFSLEKAGSLIFYAIAAPGKSVDDNLNTIDDLIKDVVKNGVTDEELQKAKNITEASFIGDKKNVLEKAESLASYTAYENDPNLINTELDKYLKVTKDDIIRVAKKYLDTDKRIILIYTPKEKS